MSTKRLPLNPDFNQFTNIDYNAPIPPQRQDMRTAYNFGHRYRHLNDRIGPPNVTVPNVCRALANSEVPPPTTDYTSETRRQFHAKTLGTSDPCAERAMCSARPQFVRSTEERIFQRPPKAIAYGSRSQYGRDFTAPSNATTAPPPPPPPSQASFGWPARDPLLTIRANVPGHYKYMDPYATTNMLAHPQHSVDQQNGIGRKDCITLWDWLRVPKGHGYGLQTFPTRDQHRPSEPMDGRTLPPLRQRVPHNGMRSEQRAEFQKPPAMSVCVVVCCCGFLLNLLSNFPTIEQVQRRCGRPIDAAVRSDNRTACGIVDVRVGQTHTPCD